MPALRMREDDWTPQRLVEHRKWRARMFSAQAPDQKPEPKPDPLAAMLEVQADPVRSALEIKVRELEESLQAVSAQLVEAKNHTWIDREENDLPCRVIMIEQIIRNVAKYYGVSVLDLKSERRTMPIVRYRQIAMYLCKALTIRSLPEIGRRFGGRDHTTVLHAIRKISTRMLDDPALCQEIAELEALFA